MLRSGLLAAFLAEDAGAARAKFAGMPPELVAFFEQLPVVGTAEGALPRVRAMLAAGIRYVIFIVMPGDEETLRLLAERVLPASRSPTGEPEATWWYELPGMSTRGATP